MQASTDEKKLPLGVLYIQGWEY